MFSDKKINLTLVTYTVVNDKYLQETCIRQVQSILTGPVIAGFCNLGSSHCVVLVSMQ